MSRSLSFKTTLRFEKNLSPREKGDIIKAIVGSLLETTNLEQLLDLSVEVSGREVLKKSIKGVRDD